MDAELPKENSLPQELTESTKTVVIIGLNQS